MLTFEEALESIDEGEQLSILLANGFSQAWNADIFNYASLLEAADFGDRESAIRPLFEELNTYDFESVMNQLLAAERVLKIYDVENELINKINQDKETLKQSLIKAISNTHPDLPSEVTDEEFTSVRRFLSNFSEIFTINYDLLFYWARNKNNLEPENYTTDDGFRAGQRWVGYGTNQDVYFLHGGLHIYDTEKNIKKHAFSEEGNSIIDQVRDNLENGRFPLFVSEPTADKKKRRIEHNPYLNFGFQYLRKVKGVLFVHGHSMDDNDKHIFDQIKESDISKVFVSIFGDEATDRNTRTKANAIAYLERAGVEVEFYDAASTPVWRDTDDVQ